MRSSFILLFIPVSFDTANSLLHQNSSRFIQLAFSNHFWHIGGGHCWAIFQLSIRKTESLSFKLRCFCQIQTGRSWIMLTDCNTRETMLVWRYIFPCRASWLQSTTPVSSLQYFFLFACHVTLNSSEGPESSCHIQLLCVLLQRPPPPPPTTTT